MLVILCKSNPVLPKKKKITINRLGRCFVKEQSHFSSYWTLSVCMCEELSSPLTGEVSLAVAQSCSDAILFTQFNRRYPACENEWWRQSCCVFHHECENHKELWLFILIHLSECNMGQRLFVFLFETGGGVVLPEYDYCTRPWKYISINDCYK